MKKTNQKKYVSQRGQVTMEFVVSVIFVLAIFVYCMTIFQSRSELSLNFAEKWTAQEAANRIARNINNVYVMDENSVIMDAIYWQGSTKKIELNGGSVQVWIDDTFADAFVSTNNVNINVTDFNGIVYFRRTINGVDVNYN
ncbi:MAG: hypothetical protein WCW44_01490 [archaeon]|jgi:uncharacterized protein (UPF0333 family)